MEWWEIPMVMGAYIVVNQTFEWIKNRRNRKQKGATP